VWFQGSQSESSTTAAHAGENPSTSDNQVESKIGKVKTPCWLCKEVHHTYLFPCMDEASHLWENIVDVQPQISTDYHKISPNPPLIVELVNLIPSSVNLAH
jgi:hypothetical protein